jgi:hypothetical protein
MIPAVQQAILERLAQVLELSDDIRVGQLIAFMPEMVATEDCRPHLADMDDEELLQALENHRQDLLALKARRLAQRTA